MRRRLWRVTAVSCERAQLGWVCAVCFRHTTGQQFTDVHSVVQESHRWPVVALWRAYRAARAVARRDAPKPGDPHNAPELV
jgi:hypothetical protein